MQQHVAAAVAAGGSLDECRRLLTRLTQATLPEAVEERLATWRERFGALSIRPAVVLESRTSNELDAVLDDDRARPFVRQRLGPTRMTSRYRANAREKWCGLFMRRIPDGRTVMVASRLGGTLPGGRGKACTPPDHTAPE